MSISTAQMVTEQSSTIAGLPVRTAIFQAGFGAALPRQCWPNGSGKGKRCQDRSSEGDGEASSITSTAYTSLQHFTFIFWYISSPAKVSRTMSVVGYAG